MSQYDAKIVYVKGEDNTVADALSRLPTYMEVETDAKHAYAHCPNDEENDMLASIIPPLDNAFSANMFSATSYLALSGALCRGDFNSVCATLSISMDKDLLHQIRTGYAEDKWVTNILAKAKDGMPGIQLSNGLWYVGSRLIIPRMGDIRETLFRLAHDILGHFGFDKTYGSLQESFYWPNMRKELESAYVPGCVECQCNKSTTSKPIGPLHPLPVPDAQGDSVAIDFIGPLLVDEGFNMIVTLNHLGADICILPCHSTSSAEDVARIFFDNWYCDNGLPLDIISDRDKLFVSKFWKALHVLTGTKIKMSMAYHPETDGTSERTNKTVNQMLRYHVE